MKFGIDDRNNAEKYMIGTWHLSMFLNCILSALLNTDTFFLKPIDIPTKKFITWENDYLTINNAFFWEFNFEIQHLMRTRTIAEINW